MCGVHDKFSSINTPRSFCLVTFSIQLSLVYKLSSLLSSSLCLAPNNIYLVFIQCIVILFCFPHVFVLSKSVCISEFITLISGLFVWIVKSSANKSEKQYFRMRGRSFINKRNKVVPRIEPCGTPDLIVENDENPKPLSMAC